MGLGQFVHLRVGLGKKERGGGVFEAGDTPMHTMFSIYAYFLTIFFLFFIKKGVLFSFSFLFSTDISNICNRILINQKPE